MNDFTKEELESMLEDLEGQMVIYRPADNDFNRNLRKKLKILIDNYCEHTYADNFIPGKLICIKCKRKFTNE